MVPMLRPGQAVRVNLAGMQVGSVVFHAAVTDAAGTIVRQVSEDPATYFSEAPFLVPQEERSGSARESDRRQVRDNQLQEVSHDQRAAHTAHLGTDPRGGRRSFGRPRRSAGFQIGRGLENMFEDRSLRSDSRIVYALGGASPELRRPFARR